MAQQKLEASVPASVAIALTSPFADSRVLIPGNLLGQFIGKDGNQLAAIAGHFNIRAYIGIESLLGGDKLVVFESSNEETGMKTC